MSKLILPSVEPYRFHDAELGDWADIAREVGASMALTYLAAATAATNLGNITTTGLFTSIHSASPSNTGANELVAGTAYTAVSGGRPPVTWGSVTTGVVTSSDTQTFAMLTLEASGIPYFGIWTANSAGTWLFGGPTSGLSGSIPIGANVTFTSAITLTQAG